MNFPKTSRPLIVQTIVPKKPTILVDKWILIVGLDLQAEGFSKLTKPITYQNQIRL